MRAWEGICFTFLCHLSREIVLSLYLQMELYVCLRFFLYLFGIQSAFGQCLNFKNCFCISGIVSCSGLTKFPMSFPEDTTTITISHFDVEEIPSTAFTNLPVLHSVEIFAGNISKISTNAFNGLSDFDRISLGNVTVGTIESEAFSDLSDFGTLSIYRSNIGLIRPRAFYGIFALDYLRIFSSNITTVAKESFYMLEEAMNFGFFSNNVQLIEDNSFASLQNLGTFEMYHNDIKVFGSGNIEYMVHSSGQVSVYSNTFTCDCHISHLLRNRNLTKHLYYNWCYDRKTRQKVDLVGLSRKDLSCDDMALMKHKETNSSTITPQGEVNTGIKLSDGTQKTSVDDIYDGTPSSKPYKVVNHTETITAKPLLSVKPTQQMTMRTEKAKRLITEEAGLHWRSSISQTSFPQETSKIHPGQTVKSTLILPHGQVDTGKLFADVTTNIPDEKFDSSGISSFDRKNLSKPFSNTGPLPIKASNEPDYEMQNDHDPAFPSNPHKNKNDMTTFHFLFEGEETMTTSTDIFSTKNIGTGTTFGLDILFTEDHFAPPVDKIHGKDVEVWASSKEERNRAINLGYLTWIITIPFIMVSSLF